MQNGSKWQNEPVTSGESICTYTWWIRCKNINKWPHHKERIWRKKDTEIVCFNDVSTCSLTTKRRQQRTRGEEKKKWRHKMDNCGFVETKKRQMSLLFYCTVHSIMWTIRNSKALGKKIQLLSVGYSIVFEVLHNIVFAVLFSLHLRCLMKPHSKDTNGP